MKATVILGLTSALLLGAVSGGSLPASGATPDTPSRTQTQTELEIDFPEIEDFSAIPAEFQSPDPEVYNFQMWARRNGLFAYFVQYVKEPELSNASNWANTHVEMMVYSSFGYEWGGTFIGLFLDETVYINSTWLVRGYYLETQQTETADGYKLEYWFWVEYDNNSLNAWDRYYAYVKPYQYLPGSVAPHSQSFVRDGRLVITGYETSFQIHDKIDAYMTE